MTLVRLSKLMGERKLCSRREADRLIEKGWVLVDGQIVDVLGTKVSPQATISLKNEATQLQKRKLTLLLNKPLGIVSCQPEKDYKEALELINPKSRDTNYKTQLKLPSIVPYLSTAGRLDINSTGLLILTEDGRIAKQLIGEDSEIEKEYLVRIDGIVTPDKIRRLQYGLILDGKRLKAAKVDILEPHLLRFTLKEGRKRQIRRMCDCVQLYVTAIKRVRVGQIRLQSLKEGCWRFLEADESF